MMSQRPHRVAVLALPAVLPLELGAAAQIFGRDQYYRLTVCAEGRSASLPGSGLTINTPAGLEGLERANTVIIPGYEDVDAVVSTAVLDAMRAAHARGARLVSICTAAFALAAAGVLDDRPATTHWRWTAELQDRYPKIDVLPNRLFVDDGDILTSAGVTTGIDLCLHLVRRDFGSAAANTRARGLVAAPQRQGGQAQFIERLMPDASGDQLGPLRQWMLAHALHGGGEPERFGPVLPGRGIERVAGRVAAVDGNQNALVHSVSEWRVETKSAGWPSGPGNAARQSKPTGTIVQRGACRAVRPRGSRRCRAWPCARRMLRRATRVA